MSPVAVLEGLYYERSIQIAESALFSVENFCDSLSAAVSWLAGPMMLWSTRRERQRLKEGFAYEPRTFIERRNWVEA
jgi:hypothetical protein